jgi:hypothetical protein
VSLCSGSRTVTPRCFTCVVVTAVIDSGQNCAAKAYDEVLLAEAYSAAIDWAKKTSSVRAYPCVSGMLLFNSPTLLYKIRMFIRDPLLCALLGQILKKP